jgi:predicted Zn finger-like uncharacterized protein
MKVQCGQCPAKYAVADERIREKKVRIHCKRCNAAIVVDGKVDPPLVTTTPARPSASPSRPSSSPAPEVPAPEMAKPPSPRPVAHTIMGGLEAPAAARLAEAAARPGPPPKPARGARQGLTPPSNPRVALLEPERGKPSADRGFTDPPEGDDERWRVALTQNDLRWMTTEEIGEAYRAGAVQLETFVFRAGMATWVTLLEVPELASALGHSFVEAPPLGSIGAHAPPLDPEAGSPREPLPPRKVPGSRPDAAVAPMRSTADDPLPFALVGRNNAGRGAAEAAPGTESPRGGMPVGVNSLPTPLVPPPADVGVPQIPAAAPVPSAEPVPAEPPSSKSSTWMWVVAALILLAAVVVFFGPRFGLRFR